MCLAFSAVVEETANGKVIVKVGEEKRECIDAVGGLKKGDSVLVQQGMVVDKID